MTVLAAAGVVVPGHFMGDGAAVLPGPDGPRHCVVSPSRWPNTGRRRDLTGGFEILGEIAARLHSTPWPGRGRFGRGAWDLDGFRRAGDCRMGRK